MLDAAEYFHLALHASKKGDNHAALAYLKEVLAQEPANASAIYMLAAEHAELGLYDRAAQGMETALQLAPDLDVARFQLGLLQLQMNARERADATFSELAARSKDVALGIYARAYLAIFRNDIPGARQLLQEGNAACHNNPALKADMERVLVSLSETGASVVSGAASVSPSSNASAGAGAIFLGAYKDPDDAAS